MDLDNDGENELIIRGTYGGVYFDARDNKVCLARGDGDANILSYTYYNGEIWILYSNSVNEGAESYHMEKYEGADKLVAKMNFSEKFADANNPKAGKKYVLNGKKFPVMNMPHLPVKSLRLKKVQTENLILGIHFLLLKSVKFSMKKPS